MDEKKRRKASFLLICPLSLGGDLGGFTQKGSLQPEFEEVAFAMDTVDEHKAAVKGEKEPMKSYNYGLCKTVFGYHIILLEGKK
jgi:hypothetical protein